MRLCMHVRVFVRACVCACLCVRAADFYLDLISVDHRDPEKEQESAARIARVQDEYEPAAEVRPELHQESLDEQASKDVVTMEKYPSTWLTQLAVLAHRAFLQVTRDKLPLIIAYFQVTGGGERGRGRGRVGEREGGGERGRGRGGGRF